MCSFSWIFTNNETILQCRLIWWKDPYPNSQKINGKEKYTNPTPDAASAFAVPINPPPLYKPHRYLALEISEQVEFLEQT